MRLDRYTTGTYTIGAPIWKQLLWYFIGAPFLRSYLIPFSGLKVNILRWFGAEIGQDVRIKTGVRVKFPWRLVIKDFVWIGEDVWLDNLDLITIESHCCISQNVYLYCASQGLATVVRGMLDRSSLSQAMKLRPDQKITLAQTVGYPK